MQKSRIICAIDSADIEYAYKLAHTLKNKIAAIKLGLEFFTAYGIDGIKKMEECGIPIFLDLKLHDIPNTVARTLVLLKDLNIFMLTIHISGGANMIKAAINELNNTNIKVIGVTMLTSLTDNDLASMGFGNHTITEQVINLATLAQQSNLDGVVCSGHEIVEVRKNCGKNFILVVPGIRLSSNGDDQKRIITPAQAIKLGADYLVIGRDITSSSNPLATVDKITDDIEMLKEH